MTQCKGKHASSTHRHTHFLLPDLPKWLGNRPPERHLLSSIMQNCNSNHVPKKGFGLVITQPFPTKLRVKNTSPAPPPAPHLSLSKAMRSWLFIQKYTTFCATSCLALFLAMNALHDSQAARRVPPSICAFQATRVRSRFMSSHHGACGEGAHARCVQFGPHPHSAG